MGWDNAVRCNAGPSGAALGEACGTLGTKRWGADFAVRGVGEAMEDVAEARGINKGHHFS
ncbi:hypothetical protein AM231_23255 [Paenibacillus solani]|uniref:Uncharacterized protein n=1 Tax=Paenibacillus solani TaxID=1705565 RepID=A0A0M1N3Y5_9BACL|nr:hypothetical protein AM231_23255 [Paenibacillus solani]